MHRHTQAISTNEWAARGARAIRDARNQERSRHFQARRVIGIEVQHASATGTAIVGSATARRGSGLGTPEKRAEQTNTQTDRKTLDYQPTARSRHRQRRERASHRLAVVPAVLDWFA
jgi:hypothetical protein